MAQGVAPDVRDGLTATCRRALYEVALTAARTPLPVESSRIVDSVLRKGHVDGGRRAIYLELVRMARDWEMRHPLVDAQGDLGSIDGDDAVSADYSEMRLASLGGELLRDTGEELAATGAGALASVAPAVLPARLPNLLVNGSFSAATGSASCIPPHNLREVVDATLAYIDDPQIDVAGLMRHLPGPDFPTGGVVLADGLHEAYATGRGAFAIRARTTTEPGAIVVSELPFMMRKGGRGGVVADIRRAMRSRKVRGVQRIDDQSGASSGLRLVLELRRGADPEVVLEELYAHTRLQTTCLLRLVASIAGEARTITLRDAVAQYVAHRREVVTRSGLRADDRDLDIVRADLLDVAERHADERRSEIA